MRYIDADELIKQIEHDSKGKHGQYGDEWQFMDTICNQPTADVVPMDYHERCLSVEIQKRMNMVEVVRCKDCKYNRGDHKCLFPDSIIKIPDDNDFCSYGKRVES